MDFSKLNIIKSYTVVEDLLSWITVQPKENAFTDENITAEQDDNSLDYEARRIINNINNGIFIHADNGVGLSTRPEVTDIEPLYQFISPPEPASEPYVFAICITPSRPPFICLPVKDLNLTI